MVVSINGGTPNHPNLSRTKNKVLSFLREQKTLIFDGSTVGVVHGQWTPQQNLDKSYGKNTPKQTGVVVGAACENLFKSETNRPPVVDRPPAGGAKAWQWWVSPRQAEGNGDGMGFGGLASALEMLGFGLVMSGSDAFSLLFRALFGDSVPLTPSGVHPNYLLIRLRPHRTRCQPSWQLCEELQLKHVPDHALKSYNPFAATWEPIIYYNINCSASRCFQLRKTPHLKK